MFKCQQGVQGRTAESLVPSGTEGSKSFGRSGNYNSCMSCMFSLWDTSVPSCRCIPYSSSYISFIMFWQFHSIVINEFVKQNSWPELVSDLFSAIQNSNLSSNGAECQMNAINALSVLCTTCRPFQVRDFVSATCRTFKFMDRLTAILLHSWPKIVLINSQIGQ